MSLQSIAKNAVRRVWQSRAYSFVLNTGDIVVGRLARRRASAAPFAKYTLLVPPQTSANIGDVAMFHSVLRNTPGNIVVTARTSSILTVPEDVTSRVRIVPMPRIIHGYPGLRIRDVARFARLAAGADELLVPGADTIDGGHLHNSLARLNTVRLAADAGVPVRVMGFSWSDHAPAAAVRALRQLGAMPGVQLFPRDPVSHERLERAEVPGLVRASDIVFSLPQPGPVPLYPELDEFLRATESAGDRYVVLNLSGLIANRADLGDDYRQLIELLHSRGLRIVFLPHVHRATDDDVATTRRYYEAYGAETDFFVDRLLDPSEIMTLTGGGLFSATGRMHCAILTLTTGRPCMTLATAGKVEGLYQFFDLDDMVIQPKSGCGAELVRIASRLIDENEELAERVLAALPKVRILSRANFDAGRHPVSTPIAR